MHFRRLSLAIVLVLLFLMALPIALWFGTSESRHIALEVQHLVAKMEDEFSAETRLAQNKLIALGPDAYPELRRILLTRPDIAAKWYARVWNTLPDSFRAQLPDPGVRSALRRNLQRTLANAGPVICRSMTGAVCAALEIGNAEGNEMTLLRNLIWSLPDSPRAVTCLSNYLARPENNSLFGSIYADELWPKIPHLAPLLAQWLRNENGVNDAARGLAHLGTNAAFALRLLVETAENGVATPRVQPAMHVSYGPDFDAIAMRRTAALRTLGIIGITNAAVIKALHNAAASTNNALIFAASLAAIQLKLPFTEELQAWAESWNPFEEFSPQFHGAVQFVNSLGKAGPKAAPALGLLDRIASGAGTDTASRFDHFDPHQAEGLRLTAIHSIFDIEPRRASPYLKFVLDHASNWAAVSLLRQWREHRAEIVPSILPHLHEASRRLPSAFILHGVAPELEEPRRILEAAIASGDLETKSTAVNWIWTLHKNPDEVLPTSIDLLKQSDDNTLQSTLKLLEVMGDAARPTVPQLKRLLTSEHWAVRERAGRLLHRIAPEEMPPIID